MKLNQTHEEMIRDFAKANKMSGPKLVDFAAQLFATIQISSNSPSKIGKKVSPHMAEVRKSVTEYLLSADKFTTIDIANKVGCSVLEANSALTMQSNPLRLKSLEKQIKKAKERSLIFIKFHNNTLLISQSGFGKMCKSRPLDEVKHNLNKKVYKMQMFTKIQTRSAARSATFGQKVIDNWQGLPEHLKGVNNGQDSTKRWGRLVEAKPTKKESLTLVCTKDYRFPEKAKPVSVMIKKNKLK